MERFNKQINVTKPLTPNTLMAADMITEVIDSEWLTNNGIKHQILEQQLTDYLDVENITLTNNGTTALLLGLKALGLTGEVITTPFTFPATVEALDWNGLTPVFCDVDPVTYNLNPDKIEELITERTTAILPVHVFGNPCDVERIQEIADRYRLKVIYDGAHAFGMEINGRPSGQWGDMTMFSFHATKLFNTIEGGGLAYNDINLKRELNLLKNFGIEGPESVVRSGLNAKLNEIQAGFGIEVLKLVPEEREKRYAVKKVYDDILGSIDGIRIVTNREGLESSYQYFAIEIEESLFGCNRDHLHELLKDYNVFTRKYFYPLCSSFEWYKSLESTKKENLPVAHNIVEKVLALPFYGDLNLEDVKYISNIILYIHESHFVGSVVN